jgi:ribosomal protein S18 acetylase RimI-like enzyme
VSARGESAHLFLLGVAERFGGKGIGCHLVAQCNANAAQKGYRLAVTEATNRTSQHIFRKLGFVERVGRSYQEHRFNGRAFFTSIAEHGGPMLMDKRLAP